MNQIICDRCKRIVSTGQVISAGGLVNAYRWRRMHPDGKMVEYDLCGKCDIATVEGIMRWADDSAHSEHSPA